MGSTMKDEKSQNPKKTKNENRSCCAFYKKLEFWGTADIMGKHRDETPDKRLGVPCNTKNILQNLNYAFCHTQRT